MSDKTQRLVTEIGEKGADATAQKIEKVGDAQKGVTKQTEATKKPLTDAAEAQDTLNVSTDQYLDILAAKHPLLGMAIQLMRSNVQQARQAADAQKKLAAATGAAGAAGGAAAAGGLGALAAVLPTLAAAAVMAGGFTALVKSVTKVREESERLRQELEALKGYYSEVEESALQAGEAMAQAARGRREGGFTGGEQGQAEAIYRSTTGAAEVRGGATDLEALKANITALVGLVSGQAIERLTVAGYQADPTQSAEVRQRRAEAALGRPETGEAWDRELERQRAARARTRTAAATEASAGDPTLGDANLRRLIERAAPGLTPEGEEAVRELVDEYLQRQQKDRQGGRLEPGDEEERLEAARRSRGGIMGRVWGSDQAGGTEAEMQAARGVLGQMGGVPRAPTVVHNHYHYGERNYGAKGRTMSGKDRLRRVRNDSS